MTTKRSNSVELELDLNRAEGDDAELQDSSLVSGTTDFDADHDDDDNVSINSITSTIKGSKAMIVFVLLAGLGGGIAFIVLGMKNEQELVDQRFETRAKQLARDIQNTVQEYEVAARSVHNVCRRRDTTREQFLQFYEYLTSGGLQFQAAQCVPNVTHEERPVYEERAQQYYSHYYPTTTNYTGFKGWEYDATTDSYPLRQHRSDAPFYFPVDLSEPVIPNAGALGLDTYSHPFQKVEIENALSTNQPVLGGRLKLVQETEKHAYTVIMRHPGISVLSETEQEEDEDSSIAIVDSSSSSSTNGNGTASHHHRSRELGVILIRIPSLLERRGDEQKESIACYLYDVTPANTGGNETYLGSAQYEATVQNETSVTNVHIPEYDIEYKDVLQMYPSNRIMEFKITIANARWTMVVTPLLEGDDAFEPSHSEAIFGGIMILVCTVGMVFFLWRNMHQMRMIHKAKSQAEAERQLIASLYPENVVQRLLDDEKAKQEAIKERLKNKGKVFDGKTQVIVNGGGGGSRRGSFIDTLRSSMEKGSSRIVDANGNGSGMTDVVACESIFGTQPIAHHYPETTILFMDMVGFTAWSRSRVPSQVFTLLENAYNAFDQIAKRRRVFKVETVGDCYVAVVGLPNPRKHHAAVMARFASDCLVKMKIIMTQLAPTLGNDTATLDLRVGLNSGPVTGGVLRGEKGRFQLFGDSMNTAARMESNGEAGKIHVSPSTAESLVASGKEKWLTPREDTIVAKGIGEMKTYWVNALTESIGTGMSTEFSLENYEDEELSPPKEAALPKQSTAETGLLSRVTKALKITDEVEV